MRTKANAYRGKIAHDFGRIFVKADVKRTFLAHTRSFSKGAREDGFTRACGTGDQHAGAAEVAAAKHRVQPFDAAGDPLLCSLWGDCRGADIGHFHSRGSDDERRLVLGETGAAVFHYLDVSQCDLIDHPLFEADHAVRHELHEPVAFADKRIISLAFRSNNPGQAALGEPVVEAVNLPS